MENVSTRLSSSTRPFDYRPVQDQIFFICGLNLLAIEIKRDLRLILPLSCPGRKKKEKRIRMLLWKYSSKIKWLRDDESTDQENIRYFICDTYKDKNADMWNG